MGTLSRLGGTAGGYPGKSRTPNVGWTKQTVKKFKKWFKGGRAGNQSRADQGSWVLKESKRNLIKSTSPHKWNAEDEGLENRTKTIPNT